MLLTFCFVLVSILVERKFTTDRYVVYKWSGCKFTADQYAVYKWLGCKFSPSPKGEGLFPYFRREDRTNEKTGFYIIKDRFFEDMPDPYLKGNKAGNRPHYYCFEDTTTGIYWMIPLSSRIDKFRKIIEKKEQLGKHCDILHIVKLECIFNTRYVPDYGGIHRT